VSQCSVGDRPDDDPRRLHSTRTRRDVERVRLTVTVVTNRITVSSTTGGLLIRDPTEEAADTMDTE